MLIKGRLTTVYKRGKYAVAYNINRGRWYVVDTSIGCPKGRMWSIGEFPTDAEATAYCKWIWQEACNLTSCKEAAYKAGEVSDADHN